MSTQSGNAASLSLKDWKPEFFTNPSTDESGFQALDKPYGLSLLDAQEKVIREQLSGILPEGVAEQVERTSVALGMQRGIHDQAQSYMTSRDLGLTVFDIQQKGLENADKLARNQFAYAQLEETASEWDDKYFLSLEATKQEGQKVDLLGFQLTSENAQFAMKLANDLIIANSQIEIAGVQGNIDALIGNDGQGGYWDPINEQILETIRRH